MYHIYRAREKEEGSETETQKMIKSKKTILLEDGL